MRVSSVSNPAIIKGSAAFFAPEMAMVPLSGLPPTIRMRSMPKPFYYPQSIGGCGARHKIAKTTPCKVEWAPNGKSFEICGYLMGLNGIPGRGGPPPGVGKREAQRACGAVRPQPAVRAGSPRACRDARYAARPHARPASQTRDLDPKG